MEWLSGKRDYGPILLRLGMVFVFLWFGLNQVVRPAHFLGYLPEKLFMSPYAQQIVIFNGAFEVVFGVLLLLGFFTRISAFVLGIHLFLISFELIGKDMATAVRDFGLSFATLAIVFIGPDKWCLDLKKKFSKWQG